MKYFNTTVWLLFFCFQAYGQSQPIRLAYSTTESTPYQLGTGTKIPSPPGIAVDIIQQAAKNLDFKLSLERLPNQHLMQYLKHTQIDGAFIYSYNINRESFAAYPMRNGEIDRARSIADLHYYLYQKQGENTIWDGSRFIKKNIVVGILKGYSIAYELKNNGVSFHEVDSMKQLVTLLKIGRIHAIAAQDSTFDIYLKEHQVTTLEKVSPALKSKSYFVVFSHSFYQQNAQVVEQFWDEIVKVKQTY